MYPNNSYMCTIKLEDGQTIQMKLHKSFGPGTKVEVSVQTKKGTKVLRGVVQSRIRDLTVLEY